jgi:hypothetical protein
MSTATAALASATAAGNAMFSGAFVFLSSPEMKDLGLYLAKTLIAWGVPVGAVGIVIISAISRASRRGDDGSLDSESQSLLGMLRGQKPGEPIEYLKIQRYQRRSPPPSLFLYFSLALSLERARLHL